jgi:hypothetical protein
MPSVSAVSVFGIRHHGPGSARSLRRALETLQPDAILVEGPPEADELLKWVVNPQLQPPVALLLYVPDQPQQGAYYPFAEFSPEWQALQYGIEHAIPTRFMDLPQAYQLAWKNPEPAADAAEVSESEAEPDPAPVSDDSAPTTNSIFPRFNGDPLAWLAETAGYSDSERWWEHMVEQRQNDPDLFTAILEMMTALRAEVESQSEEGAAAFPAATPYEAQREAFMRQTIRAAQAEGFQKIAVVCGAWHAPALVQLPPAAEDTRLLKGLAKVKVSAAWVPWSYGRLAWDSGYGAGIESPGWYHALWQASAAGLAPTEVTIRWMVQVAQLLRGQDLSASSAHVIEAVRLAETLATLRGRPIPGLPEINEAILAVFCFGDDLPLRLIREKLVINERLGRVPDDSPMTPLQANLAQTQKRLRLPPEASQRDLDLDLRTPNDLERSYLLHRLNLLDIPWGAPQRVSGKSGTFHELWRLQWKPELAVKVVEASLWGNSVESAAGGYVTHIATDTHELPVLTRLVNRALLADLPDAIQVLMTRLDAEAALASDLGQLMEALPAMAEAQRYGSVRQTDTAMIGRVVSGLVARICVGLPVACASLNDDAAAEMFERLIGVQRAIDLLQQEDYVSSWRDTLLRLADQDGLHGLLGGRVCAILLDQGVFDSQETSRRLGLALSTAAEPAQAASWVEGLLKDSGTLLVHDDGLWPVLDAWVSGLSAEAFLLLLPLLRRTFSSFTAPERRLIGARAKNGGRPVTRTQPGAPTDFDPQRGEAALSVIEKLLGIGLQ